MNLDDVEDNKIKQILIKKKINTFFKKEKKLQG
jgi:hypothetical protein